MSDAFAHHFTPRTILRDNLYMTIDIY